MKIENVVNLKSRPVFEADDSQSEFSDKVTLLHGVVESLYAENYYLIKLKGMCYSFVSKKAYSCLINPEVGDLVLVSMSDDYNESNIISILTRQNSNNELLIDVGSSTDIKIKSRVLTLEGQQQLSLKSSKDIFISCLCSVNLAARDVFSSVIESVVSIAKRSITKAEMVSVDADQLLKTHANHQILTATKDVKIDGERINMG